MMAETKNWSFENLIRQHLPKNRYELVKLSHLLASLVHQGEKRADGTSYIGHCDRMEIICTRELQIFDYRILILIKLHDTLEVDDKILDLHEIDLLFGKEIRKGVWTVTKKKGKNYYLAIRRVSWWIQIAKLIDRLDNLRTLDKYEISRITHWLEETQIFYYPLALRLVNKVPRKYKKAAKYLAEEIARAYWAGAVLLEKKSG